MSEKATEPPKQEQKSEETAKAPPKKDKKKPQNLVIPPKKPKLTKAERRALQEKQRADKAANGGQKKKGGGDGDGGAKKGKGGEVKNTDTKKVEGKKEEVIGMSGSGAMSGSVEKTLNFFSHLPPARSKSGLEGN